MDRRYNLPSNLRNLIEIKGITQKKLSEDTGISEAAISLYIKGTRIMRADTLFTVSKYFDVTLDELLYGDIK